MPENIDSLLTQIQEEIESAKKLGRSRLVDPQVLQELLEAARAAMPTTIERAKEIVAKRNEILESAKGDAERIVFEAKQRAAENEAAAQARVQEVVQSAKERFMQMRAQGEQVVAEAQEEAARLVEMHEITRTAQAEAEEISRQAQAQAEELTRRTQSQVEELMRRTRAQADDLESESRRRASETITEANDYSSELLRRTEDWGRQYTGSVRAVVEEIVNEAEEILASSLTDIRSTQKRLQTSMTKSAVPPEFYAPDAPDLLSQI